MYLLSSCLAGINCRKGNLKAGYGLTAELLIENGIEVLTEADLENGFQIKD